MGWENVFHCEYDTFCQKVLKHHFPNSKLYEDIKTFDASNYAGRIDILSGGFPCQPFSNAGLRKGTEDERHLWPQMLRIIREVSPRYVVGENVRGLLNWSGGLVFEQVCADLENEGYEVTPYLLPAAGKNAPHRRDRIWFVAQNTDKNGRSNNKRKEESRKWEQRNISARDNVGVPSNDAEVRTASDTESNGNKRNVGATQEKSEETKRKESRCEFKRNTKRDAPDTDITSTGTDVRGMSRTAKEIRGRKESFVPRPLCSDGDASDTTCVRQRGKGYGIRESNEFNENSTGTNWETFPTQPPICGGDDGLPKELDGITFSKWRKESIKAYGNAIVPQVAHEIFKAIQKMEDTFVP
jgi:DNA (cytosine-5)-methyltransferase 1